MLIADIILSKSSELSFICFDSFTKLLGFNLFSQIVKEAAFVDCTEVGDG
uniref:Uncharacterized protein n=1 Tax=Ciona intestinalis TaxID=7719 RepID=H2XR89_CIOIN